MRNAVAEVLAIDAETTALDVLRRYNRYSWAEDQLLGRGEVQGLLTPDPVLTASVARCRTEIQEAGDALSGNAWLLEKLAAPRAGTEALDPSSLAYLELVLDSEWRTVDGAGIEGAREWKALLAEENEAFFEFMSRRHDATGDLVVSADRMEGVPSAWMQGALADLGHDILQVPLGGSVATEIASWAHDDDVREVAWRSRNAEIAPETLAHLVRLLQVRSRRAQLSGYRSWAEEMGSSALLDSDAVAEYIEATRRAIRPQVEAALAAHLALKRLIHPGATRVEPWDVRWLGQHWIADLTSLGGVSASQCHGLEATFDAFVSKVGARFGLQFELDARAPVWHRRVEVWRISREAQVLGRLFLDLKARPEKRVGPMVWPMRTGRSAFGAEAAVPAEAVVIASFGTYGHLTGLMANEVGTLVHELAHAIHHVLAQGSPWFGQVGITHPVDFNEVPSQLVALWLEEPEVLDALSDCDRSDTARLWEERRVGEVLPRALSAWHFLRRAAVSHHLSALDLPAASITAEVVTEAWREVHRRFDLFGLPEPGLIPTADAEDVINYDARLYKYPWDEMLAHDLRARIVELGNDDAAWRRFADEVLAPGPQISMARLIGFLGRPIDDGPWLRWLAEGQVQASALVALVAWYDALVPGIARARFR